MGSKKKTEEEARRDILHRAARIKGQLAAVERMIAEEKKCMDVITQIMAIRSALSMLGIELLKEDILCKGSEKSIDEAYLQKLFILH